MGEGADEQVATDGVEQYVIGLSFGNSNSSIATLSPVRQLLIFLATNLASKGDTEIIQDGKAEVIANEEGGNEFHLRAQSA